VTRRIAIALMIAAGAFGQTRPAAAPSPVPSYKDLKYPPLKQVKIPEPAQFTLANGMRVFLLEDHELPLIQGLALIRTGNLFDPPDKRGLSEVMAEVLRTGGTKAKTGDQIDEQLENIAGSVESSMDESSASMSFSALKESSDQVLGTFKDLMTQPEFRQDKIDLLISQLHSSIERRNDDPQSIPDRELMSILYGRDNSYGWTIEHEHLNHIHREDLIQFYRRYYFPKNIMLAVYGDFSTAAMKDRLEKLFADWHVDQPAVPPFPPVTAKAASGIYLAEKPDVTQTFFAIGELGGTLRDKDYPALQVAADILGGGFTSRLVSEIRTKLGYAYQIYASWAANYDHPGTFRMGGSTKSASTTETLQAINVELEKVRTTEVTPLELNEAKESVLNSFVFFFDSPAKTLSRVMRYEYYGYPKDFLFTYQKAIEGVTREDVLRVAKEHFRPENLTFVAVGNPKGFGKPLASLGKVNPIDLTIPEAGAPSGKSDPATVARGHELLKRAQNALGGAEKLASVKDSTQVLEMAAQGGMKIKQSNRYLAPGYFRQDQELPFGKITAYTDGKMGWLSTPQGFMPMPAPVLKQAQGEVFRNLPHVMLADRDPSLEVTATGENAVEISSQDGERVTIEFDASTGLPASETYQQPGAAAKIEETFSDWRDVEGLKMPFKMTLLQNGKPAGELTVQGYKLNSGLKVEELSKRP
jgi:zinc protease